MQTSGIYHEWNGRAGGTVMELVIVSMDDVVKLGFVFRFLGRSMN